MMSFQWRVILGTVAQRGDKRTNYRKPPLVKCLPLPNTIVNVLPPGECNVTSCKTEAMAVLGCKLANVSIISKINTPLRTFAINLSTLKPTPITVKVTSYCCLLSSFLYLKYVLIWKFSASLCLGLSLFIYSIIVSHAGAFTVVVVYVCL